MRRSVAGTTMLETLIGAVLLALVAGPLVMLLTTSSRQIRSTDRTREVRDMMDRVLARAEATDLTLLWDSFGVEPEAPGRMKGILAEHTPGGQPGRNPLLLDRALLDRIAELKLDLTLEYRFMSRKELGIDHCNRLKSKSGVLHLQAGVATLEAKGELQGRPFSETVQKPIYCPMILGRPGLLLSQCPAVNPALRDGKFKDMP